MPAKIRAAKIAATAIPAAETWFASSEDDGGDAVGVGRAIGSAGAEVEVGSVEEELRVVLKVELVPGFGLEVELEADLELELELEATAAEEDVMVEES